MKPNTMTTFKPHSLVRVFPNRNDIRKLGHYTYYPKDVNERDIYSLIDEPSKLFLNTIIVYIKPISYSTSICFFPLRNHFIIVSNSIIENI